MDFRILMTPEETADRLSLGRSTVYKMLRAGTIPSISIGRSVRVPVAALNEWVERQQAGRTDSAGLSPAA